MKLTVSVYWEVCRGKSSTETANTRKEGMASPKVSADEGKVIIAKSYQVGIEHLVLIIVRRVGTRLGHLFN